MIGREIQRDRIVEVAHGGFKGKRTALFIEGTMGIGKTALINDAMTKILGRVIRCQTGIEEQTIPFQSVQYFLERVYSKDFDAILEKELPLYEMAGACSNFLLHEPTTLVIDDAHWIDEASAQLLKRILTQPLGQGTTFVFAYRPDQAPTDLINEIRRSGIAYEHMTLQPLPVDDIAHIVAPIGAEGAKQVAKLSEGNPLFATLLAVAYEDNPQSLRDVFKPFGNGAGRQPTLLETVRHDISTLPERELLLAQTLAVINRVHPEALRKIAQLSKTDLLEAWQTLKRRQIIKTDDNEAELMHPIIRSAAYHSADHAWTVHAHRIIANLSSGITHVERLEHLSQLGIHQTPSEVKQIIEGAEPLIGTSPRTVANWLRSTQHTDHVRRDVLLARALVIGGSLREAEKLLRPLLGHPQYRAEARQLLAHALRMLGKIPEAHALLDDSINIPDPALQIERATLSILHEEQHPVNLNLSILSDIARDSAALQVALSALNTMAALNAGDVAKARDLFEGIGEQYLELPAEDIRDIIDTVPCAGWNAYFLDRAEQAIAIARRGIRVANRYGRYHVLAHLKMQLAFALIHAGRLDEADASATEAVTYSTAYSTPEITSMAITASLMVADWREDRPRIIELLEAFEAAPQTTSAWWRRTTMASTARIRARAGFAVTIPDMEDVHDVTVALRNLDFSAIAAAAGDHQRAAEYLQRARAHADCTGLRSQQALVAMVEAQAMVMSGAPLEVALEKLRWAIQVCQEIGMPHRVTAAQRIYDELTRSAQQNKMNALTNRELEVARLVANGETNQQIARKLNISRRTAEDHVSRVLTKLGVSSRAGVGQILAEESMVASDTGTIPLYTASNNTQG